MCRSLGKKGTSQDVDFKNEVQNIPYFSSYCLRKFPFLADTFRYRILLKIILESIRS